MRSPVFPYSIVHWIILTTEQVALAVLRFETHGNDAPRFGRHLRREGDARLSLYRAVRKVEQRFGIDLGTVCFKFVEKETRPTPTVQQSVMNYVAHWWDREDGTRALVISVDRAREIDRLAQGETEWLTLRDS